MKIRSIYKPSDESVGVGEDVVFSFDNGLSISISSSTDSYATYSVFNEKGKIYTEDAYLALCNRVINKEEPSGMSDYHLARIITLVSRAKKIVKIVEYEFNENE